MHILLTRPPGDSRNLAQALEQLGHQVSKVPLLEIQPLDEAAREQRLAEILSLGEPDGIVCASKHSVIWGLPQLIRYWPNAKENADWYAIGGGTAAALLTLGVTALTPQHAKSEGLLELPALQQVTGRRLLYIAGEDGRLLIETELERRGATVSRWEVYRRRPDLAAGDALMQIEVPDVLTAMSGDSVLALDQALPANSRKEWLGKRLVVPSERVAALARQRGFLDPTIVSVTEKDWPLDYLASL